MSWQDILHSGPAPGWSEWFWQRMRERWGPWRWTEASDLPNNYTPGDVL